MFARSAFKNSSERLAFYPYLKEWFLSFSECVWKKGEGYFLWVILRRVTVPWELIAIAKGFGGSNGL